MLSVVQNTTGLEQARFPLRISVTGQTPFLWRIGVVFLLCSLLSCGQLMPTPEREASTVLDERLTLGPHETKTLPIQIRDGISEVKVEATHLLGGELDLLFLDRPSFDNLQSGREWNYFSIFSSVPIQQEFDSEWHPLEKQGVYYVILRNHQEKDSDAHIRVQTR